MSKGKYILLIGLLLIVSDITFGQGCSQCKLLAEQGVEYADEASFGSNINAGILLLMTVPYILLFALFHKRIFSFIRGLLSK